MDDRKHSCDRLAMQKAELIAETNRLREGLRQAHADGLVDYKELSAAVGMNPTYVQQFVTKGSPKILHAHLAGPLKAALDAAIKNGGPRSEKPGGKASGEQEIKRLLRRIDRLTDDQVETIYGVIEGFIAASQTQSPDRDRPEFASPRRGSEPSRRQPQRSTS